MSKTLATLLGIVGLFIAAPLVLALLLFVNVSTESGDVSYISPDPMPVVQHDKSCSKGHAPTESCGKTARNEHKSPGTLPDKKSDPPASPEIIETDLAPAENTSQARDWVDAPPRSVGDAYRMSIAVGPYTTRAECDAKLPAALQEALDRYVEVCLGGEEVRQRIVLPDDYLRQLVKDQREEVSEHSFGPMITLHVLLEFDRKAKDRVLDELRRTKVAGRLWFAGFGWVVWLALLGGVYGYLRIAGSKKSG